MTDQRPQYGELATPEEQRIAAGLPPQIEEAPAQMAPVVADAAASARPHPVDRMATIAMLGYGLVSVVMTGKSYLDMSTVMNQALTMLGIDAEFTNFASGKLWGTIAAVVLVIGWVVTAFVAVRRIRRGRLAWWIPVVGAVVTTLVTSICVSIPLMGDPAFADYLTKMGA